MTLYQVVTLGVVTLVTLCAFASWVLWFTKAVRQFRERKDIDKIVDDMTDDVGDLLIDDMKKLKSRSFNTVEVDEKWRENVIRTLDARKERRKKELDEKKD